MMQEPRLLFREVYSITIRGQYAIFWVRRLRFRIPSGQKGARSDGDVDTHRSDNYGHE